MNIGGFLRQNAVGIALTTGPLLLIGLIIAPVFLHARDNARRSNCQSQLKATAMACLQYQADNNGRYMPLSDGGSQGWSLILQKFASTTPLKFSCPNTSQASYSPTSDYFFNAHLATRKETSVSDPMFTIAFGEGVDNGPTNSHYWELPNDYENPDSALARHSFGSNYAFADGHVKTLSPNVLRRELSRSFLFDTDASKPMKKQENLRP